MSTKRECSPPLPGPEGRGGGSVEPCKLDEGFYIIDETKEMAQAVIEPFIAEVDAHEKGNLDWVRDIVEGNPTDERIINCTKDEKDPSNPVDKKYPFYLVENKVQKGGVEEYIHYLAIPKDYMKIRSLRHLRKTEEDHIEEGRNEEDHIKEGRNEEDHIKEGRNEEDHIKEGRNEEDHIKEGRNEEDHIKEGRNEEDQKKEGRNKEDHIELLETILEDSKKKFKEFGIPGEKLHIYIKYPPADWFLHVHFHAIYLTPDIMIGKAHPLVTVISNLKMNGRYYEEVTLAVSLKERCLNLGCFYQYYELTKKPEEDKEREEEREVWRRKHMDCVVLYEKTRGKISEEHAKTKMTKGKKYFPFKKVKEILELNFKYNISENNIKEKPYFLGETKVRIKLSDGRSKFYLMKAAREFESYYGVSEFISGNTKKVFKELFQLKKDNKEKHQPNKANKAEIKQLYTCNGIIKVLMKGEQHMHDVTTQDQLETFILKYKLTSPNTLQ
ncbi:uncharacterized protein [Procambarus clarkii]|uniref:uncharacterized protein isoform X2 n=1 Tax=Procambarus clarkii TaxID=6728 RepID=UPI0037423936